MLGIKMLMFVMITTVSTTASTLKIEQCNNLNANNINHHIQRQLQIEFTDYNAYIFNNFTHIDDITEQTIPELIAFDNTVEMLGAIVLKHGLQSVIGVANVHKHFDLTDDEQMIFQVNLNMHNDIPYFAEALGEKERKELDCEQVPFMFKLVQLDFDKYIWSSFQFLCVNKNETELIEDIYLLIESNSFSYFLNEISGILMENEMYDKAAIYWRFEEYFVFEKPFGNLVEYTHVDRSQTFEKKNNGIRAFPTRYLFEDNDEFVYNMEFETSNKLEQCSSLSKTSCSIYCIMTGMGQHSRAHLKK